ncbi:TPA: efflux RND transporter permease subunit [Pseudomonas aeruginosa]|nr:efflux RND transporter permease subunit [Pseudomonas aeruginosa]HCF5621209.1 efflux RND transporter permease subunit [Pseudomonas aeruginosa]
MARFFIDRPVFAWVISLLIVLAGVLAIRFLPVAQYPDIAPPVVNVSASYPGASAKVVEEAVTAIIEREMNGAPGLLYTKATSSTGQASLTLTFRQGVNADLAAVEVQNRLKIVESRLPESVRRDGIYVEKAADSIQLIVTLTSSSGRYDAMELGEIASSNVLQALRRVEGVGKVETWGAEYAMRIWPDPAKLTSMNLSASDLVNAVRRHNARLTVGDIGNLGVPDSAPISATVKVDDTLVTPEQFGEIPLRIRADGGAIRLRDVARVEFGQSEYGFVSRVNQMTATGLAVKMAPGSNAVATAKRIRATLDELSRYFPEGVSYNIPYDTSAFVEISIRKVVSTLLEAMLLVFAVMYLFMQNFRATLIPTLVVPVALLGTFTVMLGLGFSINVLTMFGMVLAVSIGFSAFLALSLTPALCATLLRPIDADHHEKRGFFGWFNRAFLRLTGRYRNAVAGILARPIRWMLVYALVIGVVALLFVRLPQAFLPEEDQGDFMIMVMQPEGTPMAETMANVGDVERYLAEHEPVAYAYAVGGFSLYGDGTSSAMIFATLKDWSERREASQHVGAIVERINQRFAGLPNRTVYAMNSPPLPDLGSTSGFDFRLQDRGGVGYEALVKARDQLLARAAEDPRLANVMFAGQGEAPQIRLDIDRRKAETLGVSMDEINTTLAVMFGSDYIGDFMHGSQVRKVVVQADGAKRLGIDDIGRLHVRNEQGEMVPLATFAKAAWTLGPPQLTRYNGYPSFNLEGQAAPGYSSGEAMQAMEQLMQGLPEGIAHEWSGQSFEERLSGAQAPALFALSVLIVFLALAALYESWSIPLAVILVVPLGVLGALLGVSLRGLPNDIYFKVGLITIIGLSAKNAILIIEVAKDHYQEGMSLLQATLEAARLRLRPIVMTSLAFGFGVVPLALSSGAGSGAQVAIGTGVLGGIVTATVLAVFLVPLFFLVVGRLFRLRKAPRTGNSPQIPTEQA